MWLEFLLLSVAVTMLLVLALLQRKSHQQLPVLLWQVGFGVAAIMIALATIGLIPYYFQGFQVPRLALRAIYAVSGITLIVLFVKTCGIRNPRDGRS